ARYYSNIRRDLIHLAIEEANASFVRSGISKLNIRLVHAYQTRYREMGTHFDHLFRFADSGDGIMEEVHRKRNRYKADMAVLIVDDSAGCGLAAGIAPTADRAFGVVHHGCAATSYSLAHEIGHILGARHDRALDEGGAPFPFGHGYVHGREWRTMMSYDESCGKCPRLPVWSNPDLTVRGALAGDRNSNNARAILERAANVAAFR
ncbi:MAG: M12 family metallo-peptidase, partial [Candidatus Binatia bacterium]